MNDYAVRTVTFNSDGSMTVEYTSPADYRQNGLMVNHVVFVPAGSDYDDELDAVRDAVFLLLDDALDDLDRVPVLEPPRRPEPDADEDD